MFDQSYFTGGLKSLLQKVGGNPIVEVTLATGEHYFARSVDHATSGYVALQVHPEPGDRALRKGVQILTVPYSSITSVLVSSTDADKHTGIGYTDQPA
jgi:hypothetical protein